MSRLLANALFVFIVAIAIWLLAQPDSFFRQLIW
jgi:hypothetical protein